MEDFAKLVDVDIATNVFLGLVLGSKITWRHAVCCCSHCTPSTTDTPVVIRRTFAIRHDGTIAINFRSAVAKVVTNVTIPDSLQMALRCWFTYLLYLRLQGSPIGRG